LATLAVGSRTRSLSLHGTPTVSRAGGIANVELTAWNGSMAACRTCNILAAEGRRMVAALLIETRHGPDALK